MASEHPLLVLPTAVRGTPAAPQKLPFGGARSPGKKRQVERLSPKFALLEQALEERRIALQAGAAGVCPEQVLVFETNGSVKAFYEAVSVTPGLSWLVEDSLTGLEPDMDFHHVGDDREPTDEKLSARVYLVMTNLVALRQLLNMWQAWKKKRGRRLQALKPWSKVFAQLRDVRQWNAKDRLLETGILDQWREAVGWGGASIRAEIELWLRNEEKRREAVARVATVVEAAGGQVLRTLVIPEIAYHTLLVTLPRAAVEAILAEKGVELVQADDIRFFRPVPQMRLHRDPHRTTIEANESIPAAPNLGDPVVAILDGLPIENHALLKDRLIVDDPDGFGSNDYPAASRYHGTSMASLIIHGDLLSKQPPSSRRLYVRPILRPNSDRNDHEEVPEDEIWLDLVHRSIKRMYDGDSSGGPTAHKARIVNLSVGDHRQPFIGSMSPIARLIDWLSWTYQTLFMVSAGNHSRPLKLPAMNTGLVDEPLALKALNDNHRHSRILAPGEAMNAITVGALHDDNDDWTVASYDQLVLLHTPGLPSPFSGLGRGYRRSVKPDVLAPGGRAVFNRQPPDGGEFVTFEPAVGPKLPGQRSAAPGRISGDLSSTVSSTGSSNATALATRVAEKIYDAVLSVQEQLGQSSLGGLPPSVLTKALLVHTADWSQPAFGALANALKTKENASLFRDLISAFLGYGQLRPERAITCTPQRATFLAGGFAKPGDLWVHSVPLPACLHAQRAYRRLTVTLAWFTPINPRDRRYRCVNLAFSAPKDHHSPLGVKGQQVHASAVSRGTVQHEVLDNSDDAMDLPLNAVIEIPVLCSEDAPLPTELPPEGVPYALVISLEVAPETALPIYEEVKARIRTPVRVGP